MKESAADDDPNAASRKLGESYASAIGLADWSLDNSEAMIAGELPEDLLPEVVPEEPEPIAPAPSKAWIPTESETPPTPRQIVEALLFASGEPVEVDAVCALIRGLKPKAVLEEIAELNRLYTRQHRPYRIVPKGEGHRMELLPEYRGIQAKMLDTTRELQLPQPALEVLSLIAYKQPVTKADIDRIRTGDAVAILRQLAKYGLISSLVKAEDSIKVAYYSTTAKFLDLFGLRSLEDLPQLGETEQVL